MTETIDSDTEAEKPKPMTRKNLVKKFKPVYRIQGKERNRTQERAYLRRLRKEDVVPIRKEFEARPNPHPPSKPDFSKEKTYPGQAEANDNVSASGKIDNGAKV